jgi:DNA-binding HxlR family transcriptional regulator
VRNYGQFCPIARGSEILAERWTPIIVRNILQGCRTFNEIAAGAPGLSRALLTRRLRELERFGVIRIRPKPGGYGSLYEPTPAGGDLQRVLETIGGWAERWTELTTEHSDPEFVLWSWCQEFLRRDLLPDRRVVVRFDFAFSGRRSGRRTRGWLLIERREAELCRVDPGFGDDLVVTVNDPLVLAQWHMGRVGWAAALRSGGIQVSGPRALGRALPTWNAGPETNARRHAELEPVAAGRQSSQPMPSPSLSRPNGSGGRTRTGPVT